MALLNSILITSLVQKIKENIKIKCSNNCIIISLLTSFIFGTFFSLTFSNLDLLSSFWSSILSFIGADYLYKILEGKIFKSLSTIKEEKNL